MPFRPLEMKNKISRLLEKCKMKRKQAKTYLLYEKIPNE